MRAPIKLTQASLRRLKDNIFGFTLRNKARRVCTRCAGTRFERLPRNGMLQEHLMPFFSLYPWRCVLCTRVIYRTLRRNQQDPGDGV